MKSLKEKLVGSSAWLTTEYILGQLLRLVANIIMSRILFPEAFGIMALVQVFLQGLEMVTDTGIRGAIIGSNQRDNHLFLDTAWTIQVVRSFMLLVIVVGLAPFYAKSLGEPQLVNLIIASSAINIIHSLTPTKSILAGIQMRHKLLVTIRLFASFSGALSTIFCALITESIWSFVFGSFITCCIRTILSYTLIPGRNNYFRIGKQPLGEIFFFSFWVFLSSAATFGVNQFDKIIIGSLIGTKTLGLYNVAYFIASAPKLLFDSINSRIGHPLYSSKSNVSLTDIRKFQMLSVGGASAGVTVLALLSPWVISLLYDDRYSLSAQMAPFIAVSLIPSILSSCYCVTLLAKGYSRVTTIYMLIKVSLQVPFMYFLTLEYGTLGMIFSLPLVEIITYPILLKFLSSYAHRNLVFDVSFIAAWAISTIIIIQVNTFQIEELSTSVSGAKSQKLQTKNQLEESQP